ncbi:PleD family two-component system response regulator [Rhodoferax sp.]|uniref:response regulator n=1 Tax=Rhodoferax sp. TaxID=50421 RepID=UPI00374DA0D9
MMLLNTEIDVLVVDDMADAAESLALLLEGDGYRVRIALSGQEAVEALSNYQPSCVLLDFQMPGMDGLELARHIRAKFADDVILIACTGMPESNERVAEAFAVVDHYFMKPIPPAELRKIFPPKTPPLEP